MDLFGTTLGKTILVIALVLFFFHPTILNIIQWFAEKYHRMSNNG